MGEGFYFLLSGVNLQCFIDKRLIIKVTGFLNYVGSDQDFLYGGGGFKMK